MTDFVARATAFVHAEFPQAEAAFLGGSAATGRAGVTSDLDVLVVLPDDWADAAFVQTTRFHGQLVEAFGYGRAALQSWLETGRRNRRPVLDHLIADGRPLLGVPEETTLAAASRTALAGGPLPLDDAERRQRTYALSALLDDLEDERRTDPAELAVVMASTWTAAAELALLADRLWLGSGKWLVRRLRDTDDRHGLVAWAASPGDRTALADAVRSVLAAAGGYLQEGMMRGERPPGL